MWWNQAGWGPMYGMWLMPFFGLLCMLIFVYFISRIFNRNGGCCGSSHQNHQGDPSNQDALLEEIRALRREVEELREKQKEEHGDDGENDGTDADGRHDERYDEKHAIHGAKR